MAAPRATTIQQRFGFKDADLKTPKHDEMMLWLDSNVKDIAARIVGFEKTWNESKVQELASQAHVAVDQERTRAKIAAEMALSALEDHRSQVQANDGAWYVQKRDRAIDWLNHVIAWQLGNPPEKPDIRGQREWEWAVVDQKYGGSKYVVGFVDMRITLEVPDLTMSVLSPPRTGNQDGHLPRWGCLHYRKVLLFEIKTTIPSLGELIRQIRMYQTYEDGAFYVIAPDDR